MLSKSLNLINIFILITFLSSSAYSMYLYSNKNKCVIDFYYKGSNVYYHYATSPNTLRSSTTKKNIFIDGYDFNTTSKKCYLKPVLTTLHINQNTYSSLMAVVAILIGFTFLFFGIYIAVEVAKK